MRQFTSKLFLTAGCTSALFFVAGCSSKTEPVAGPEVEIVNFVTDIGLFTRDFSAGRAMSDTPEADVPPSGDAIYDGRMSLRTNGVPDAVGALKLNFSFDGPTNIHGEATDFVDSDEVALEGILDIGTGTMTPATDGEFTARLSGSVKSADGSTWFYDFPLNGGLRGANAEVVGGEGNGLAGSMTTMPRGAIAQFVGALRE